MVEDDEENATTTAPASASPAPTATTSSSSSSKGKAKEKATQQSDNASPTILDKPVEVISIDDDHDDADNNSTKKAESALSATLDCDFFFDKTYEQPHPSPSTPGEKQKVRDCKACRYETIYAYHFLIDTKLVAARRK